MSKIICLSNFCSVVHRPPVNSTLMNGSRSKTPVLLSHAITFLLQFKGGSVIPNVERGVPVMKKIEQIDSYTLIEDDGKFGLLYTDAEPEARDIIVLEPVYKRLDIRYPAQEISTLFREKQQIIEKYWIRILEDHCRILEADGRCGVLYMGEILSGFCFDTIHKLSYRHFLCRDRENCVLFRFNDIGYESVRHGDRLIRMADFRFQGRLDLKGLLERLSRDFPEEYQDVMKRISPYRSSPDQDNGQYISEYSHFSGYIDDIQLTFAVQRVILDNDFSVKPLDVKYGAMAQALRRQ